MYINQVLARKPGKVMLSEHGDINRAGDTEETGNRDGVLPQRHFG